MPRDFFGNYPISDSMHFARDIKLLDDCEGTFTWTVEGTGGDDVHEFLAAAAFHGTYGMHLKTRTTSSADGDSLTVRKKFDYPHTGLLIARARLAGVDVSNAGSLDLYLAYDDGTNSYKAAVRLDLDGNKVYYLNNGGTWTELTALAMTFADAQWYAVELALDIAANEYLTIRINGLEADMSDIAIYTDGGSAARGAQVYLTVLANATGPAEVYADDFYVGEIPEA